MGTVVFLAADVYVILCVACSTWAACAYLCRKFLLRTSSPSSEEACGKPTPKSLWSNLRTGTWANCVGAIPKTGGHQLENVLRFLHGVSRWSLVREPFSGATLDGLLVQSCSIGGHSCLTVLALARTAQSSRVRATRTLWRAAEASWSRS